MLAPMACLVCSMIRTAFSSGLLFLALAVCGPLAAFGQAAENPSTGEPLQPALTEQFRRFEVVFEPDAYYTDLELIISLTRSPIPHAGEQSETEIYKTLLSRAAVLPRYLVLEASVNPLPSVGVYVRKHDPGYYDDAQISGSFNYVKALTAGFEEPYAVSLFAGDVIGFDVPESKDITGNGYSGYLFSAGNYHIKDNVLIHDRWKELEWKMKGDRKSPSRKLSWSFRIGAKLHDNTDITDILYLSFRRSRLDYKSEGASFFNNSGFEYTYDMNRKNLHPIRHYFFVDKKWPIENRHMALAVAVGFVWESADKYTGQLASGTGSNFQFILRPNLEF